MRIRCLCGQKYNIKDELTGQYVRCRKCGQNILVQSEDQPMTAQVSAPAAAPIQPTSVPVQVPAIGLDDYDPNNLGGITDNDMSLGAAHDMVATPENFPARAGARKPVAKHAKMDFSYVNIGLKLIFAGISLGLGCVLFASLFAVGGVGTIAGLLLFGAFVGNLISMVGYIFCIWVPAQTESRSLIIAANVLNGINVVVSLMSAMVSASDPGSTNSIFEFVSLLVGTGTVILFLLFLKKVSLFVGDTSAAENAWSLLIFYVAVGGISAFFMLSLMFVLPSISMKVGVIYVAIGVLTIIIVAIIWLIHFLKFIDDLEFRKQVRRR